MEKRNLVRGICFDIVHEKDFYLLLKAKKGYWQNPGGGIDSGENELEALNRETKEETGREPWKIFEDTRHFCEYDNERKGEMIHSTVASYAVRLPYSLEIALSSEDGHTEFVWASRKDTLSLLREGTIYPERAEIFENVMENYFSKF